LIPGRSKILLFSKIFIQVLRPTQPPIHWAWASFLWGKASRASSTTVKDKYSYTSVPSPCLYVLHGEKFTLYIIGYRVATGVSKCSDMWQII
jgi:hypothetical protein